VAISVHGVRERRRSLPDTVHHRFAHRRQTDLPAGDDPGPVLKSLRREGLGSLAGIQRCAHPFANLI